MADLEIFNIENDIFQQTNTMYYRIVLDMCIFLLQPHRGLDEQETTWLYHEHSVINDSDDHAKQDSPNNSASIDDDNHEHPTCDQRSRGEGRITR